MLNLIVFDLVDISGDEYLKVVFPSTPEIIVCDSCPLAKVPCPEMLALTGKLVTGLLKLSRT